MYLSIWLGYGDLLDGLAYISNGPLNAGGINQSYSRGLLFDLGYVFSYFSFNQFFNTLQRVCMGISIPFQEDKHPSD